MDDQEQTVVVFRKWRDTGTVIALFPELPSDQYGHFCDSYEQVGQHGAASASLVLRETVPATEQEYAALKRELEAAPYEYNLVVRKRISREMTEKRRAEAKRIAEGK